tara:strand:+ start:613 stop:843 length:231 start_codon:yes stop_codon:yes gene_type:complete
MKGIYYNLQFKTGKDTYLKFTKLSMRELCDKIKNNMELVYDFNDMKINPQIVYNLIKRPDKANRSVRNFCSVEYFT